MSKTLRFALTSSLLACAIGVTAMSARADVPPPEGYVEQCTVEKQAPGQECVLCGDSYYKTPDACATKLEPNGFAKACRTRGASTWKEVWCKKGASAPAASASAAPAASAAAPAPAPSSDVAAPVASTAPAADDAGKPLPENAPKRGCGACRVGAADGATGVFGFGAALGLLGLSWARRQRR